MNPNPGYIVGMIIWGISAVLWFFAASMGACLGNMYGSVISILAYMFCVLMCTDYWYLYRCWAEETKKGGQ
jgi:hypothetical protein